VGHEAPGHPVAAGSRIDGVDIAVLGPVELRADIGTPVPVAGARLRTLLVLLALDAGRAVSTDRLVDGVWGADPPGSAAGALQALVSRLRRAAPGLAIAVTPAGYRLDLDPDRVDAHRFARLVGQGRPAEALALWRGPTEFPDVARAEAVRLDELRLTARLDRAEARLRAGDDAGLVAELEALAAEHPLHEPLAGLLMRALIAAGHPGRALTAFERIRTGLADALGADPSAELSALHLDTLRGQHRRARGNLPAAVSSFVGRESDLRAVRELVAAHRLVTLTGPGGSGKTRLSVEAGHALPDRFPDGVWRVELAPLTDPVEVPQAILTALRLRGEVVISRRGGTQPV
jgi:DNA-binding SARP family transcriptional activator